MRWRVELARRGESTKGITLGYSEKKPGKSIAMRCHPDQVAMMNGLMKKHSISGVKYDERGTASSRPGRARARAMPIFGRAVGLSGVPTTTVVLGTGENESITGG